MRIAHWSIWAPNRSGMYHTTKDIIVGQRALGIDCAFIDAIEPTAKTDGQFRCESHHYADSADIYMMHLAVQEPYQSDGTPMVIALHGHPLYSMQTELYGLEEGNAKPFSTILNFFRRTTPTWFITLWGEDQGDYWAALDGVRGKPRVRSIPRGIDFGDTFTMDGPTRELEGDPVILIADQFRYFKDALPSLWGAYHYWLQNPRARVYMYAWPPVNSRERDCLDLWIQSSNLHQAVGGVFEIVDYLPEVYRAADVLISTVTCESRVVVEAQACGCAVIAPWPEGADCNVERFWRPSYIAEAIDGLHKGGAFIPEARAARSAKVREQFAIRKTAEALQELYGEIMTHG